MLVKWFVVMCADFQEKSIAICFKMEWRWSGWRGLGRRSGKFRGGAGEGSQFDRPVSTEKS